MIKMSLQWEIEAGCPAIELICGEKAQLRTLVDCLKFLLGVVSTQFDNIVFLWCYLSLYMETLPEGTFCSSPLIQPSSWLP